VRATASASAASTSTLASTLAAAVIRAELLRQAKRRRTVLGLLTMAVLPVLIVVILLVAGPPERSQGGQTFLSDIATGSGVNFALFSLFVVAQLLLVVVVALFAGDTVASEAQWGSLRYLLLRPVARSVLLRVKLTVAGLYGLLAAALLCASSILSGAVAFGTGGLTTPLGAFLPVGQSLRIYGITSAYVVTQMLVVGALAFMLSTMTDAPLGAVGGAVMIMIVSSVLDAISSLGVLRYGLPTHYSSAWFGLLSSPQETGDMVRGLALQVPWTVVPLAIGWRVFARKDVLS